MIPKRPVRTLVIIASLILIGSLSACAGDSSPAHEASIPALELAGRTDPSVAPQPGDPIAPGSYEVFMTGARVRETRWVQTQLGERALEFQLDDQGSDRLAEWTSTHTGELLLFVLDGRVIAAPTVQSAVTDGRFQITVTDRLTQDRLDGALRPIR